MKKLKIFSIIVLSFIGILALTGCTKEENITGSLPEIMDKLYEGIKESEKPMMLSNIEIDDESFEYYTFIKTEYKEALASESMVGSIPHSVVLIRLKDASKAKEVVEEIKANANPSKWICVTAENTEVLSKGDLVVLIMANDLAPKIKANFENLK